MAKQRCPRCKLELPKQEYSKSKWGIKGEPCRKCRRTAYKKHWYFKKYGVPFNRVLEMLEAQNKKCPICTTDISDTFCLDHNHETNEIRGLLCFHCNFLLGHAKDKLWILENAKKYLFNWGAKE